MKDIEERLGAGSVKPRWPLGDNFTSKVIERLGDGQTRPKPRPKWKEYINMKIHKPAFVGIATLAVVVLGGSAYAAVGGLDGVRALFGGEKHISGGDRIVKVETQNCPHIDAFNITKKDRTANEAYYYKIKASSKLTNEQVVHMVQGSCEADNEGLLNSAVAQKVASLPENKNKLVGGYVDSVITAITANSISLKSDTAIGDKNGLSTREVTQTYTHIDPHVVILYKGTEQKYSSLKVGDHVSISYRATGAALQNSETIAPDTIDVNGQTIVLITRLSPQMHEYFDYTKYNYKEFQQVTPCATTTIGYCTLDELNKK